MTLKVFLSIGSLQRRFTTGNIEALHFESGVNVLVGRPNTGKTKWLETLDYLLGDTGGNPFEGSNDEPLAEKYDAAGVELFVGKERLYVERRWKEVGAKNKIFVNDEALTPPDFQRLLLEKLHIPVLHFPKGNPMSGQTWPELRCTQPDRVMTRPAMQKAAREEIVMTTPRQFLRGGAGAVRNGMRFS